MHAKLFVGNLPYIITEAEVRDLFAVHGPVQEVELTIDPATGRPSGTAFVTMETTEGAEAALEALNGQPVQGRALEVVEAHLHEDRYSFGGNRGPRKRFARGNPTDS